jgi:chaperone protein EcpD
LKEHPIDRLKDLSWSIKKIDNQDFLVVTNPGPFHVSFIRIEVADGNQTVALDNTPMLSPLSSQRYDLGAIKPGQGLKVVFSTITDYGGFTQPVTQPINVGF